jgi:hypothetical protein
VSRSPHIAHPVPVRGCGACKGCLGCSAAAVLPQDRASVGAVPPLHHNYHNQNSRLAEIYLRFAIPILILLTRSRYLSDKRKLLHTGGDGTQPYSPTELSDYAKYLGIEPTSASEVYARWWFFALDSAARAGTYLTWIAEEALTAPLPPHWSSHRDDTGDVYFVRPPPLPSPCCSRYWIHRTSERSAVQIGQS